jgi:hypothetical protein
VAPFEEHAKEPNMARKPSDTVQLKLRFPEALRRLLERAAKANDRSMNAEIVHRLEQSFHADPAVDLVALAMHLESLGERNWKDDRLAAETVRIAVDRIIAGVAGLPRERAPRSEAEPHPEKYANAEALAAVVLRKAGLSLPE